MLWFCCTVETACWRTKWNEDAFFIFKLFPGQVQRHFCCSEFFFQKFETGFVGGREWARHVSNSVSRDSQGRSKKLKLLINLILSSLWINANFRAPTLVWVTGTFGTPTIVLIWGQGVISNFTKRGVSVK